MMIEIGSHTDDRGSEDHNNKISEYRALSIKNILVVKFNIHPDRVLINGYGESDPIIPIKEIAEAENDQRKEEIYAINRRVEIKILQR